MDPDHQERAEADRAFEAEATAAGEGRWEELGLDPPPDGAELTGGFIPETIDSFLTST